MKITVSRLKEIISEEIERFKMISENIRASEDLLAALADMEALPGSAPEKPAHKPYGERDVDYKDIMSKILKSLTDKDYDSLEDATQSLKTHSLRETRYYDVLKGQAPPPQSTHGAMAPENAGAEEALVHAASLGDKTAFFTAVDKLVSLGYRNEDIKGIVDRSSE